MTISENWKSRSERVTDRGSSMTVVYDATWDEWYTNYLDLPIIGDVIPGRWLRCEEINCEPVSNTHCKITCEFSDSAWIEKASEIDDINSWKISVTTNLMDVAILPTTVINTAEGGSTTAPVYKTWLDQWADTAPVGSNLEEAPDLTFFRPQVAFKISCYGTLARMAQLMPYVGSINSKDFFDSFTAYYDSSGQFNLASGAVGGGDSYKWRFESLDSSIVKAGVIQYDMSFVTCPYPTVDWRKPYSADGWAGSWSAVDFLEVIFKLFSSKTGQRPGVARQTGGVSTYKPRTEPYTGSGTPWGVSPGSESYDGHPYKS